METDEKVFHLTQKNDSLIKGEKAEKWIKKKKKERKTEFEQKQPKHIWKFQHNWNSRKRQRLQGIRKSAEINK